MPLDRVFSAANRQRVARSYLGPLLEGRRVLEVASLGETLRATGPFDLVVIHEATELVRPRSEVSVETVAGLLAPGGRLVCIVQSSDRSDGEGVGYYDLYDVLAAHFPRVRMFGQTPFVAFGLAEFDEAAGGLRVDSRLVDERGEQPTHYLAVAGPDEPIALGYALVQIPIPETLPPATLETAETVSEMRRALALAQGQADGAMRVSRAQVEEIEELRARLRRAAQARAELDEEMARLRRGLVEADESVLNLARRTTEEMASLAQRLTAGLRPAESGGGALGERLRQQEAALAARESALSERDERIAALEADKQDLIWRLDAAEEQLRSATARASEGLLETGEDLRAALRAREQALEEYRRAAQVHVDEVARLRDALTDQSTLVAELEETVNTAEARIGTAEREADRLRRLVAETEESDRQRRSRLAELEGTLLRIERQATREVERRPPVGEDASRLASALAEVERLRGVLQRSEGQLWEARGRLLADRDRLKVLERNMSGLSTSGPQVLAKVLEEVGALEHGLRTQTQQLREVLAEWRTALGRDSAPTEASPPTDS